MMTIHGVILSLLSTLFYFLPRQAVYAEWARIARIFLRELTRPLCAARLATGATNFGKAVALALAVWSNEWSSPKSSNAARK